MSASNGQRMGGDGFFRGLVAGTMVGVGAALLFAPKAGWRLRQDVADGMAELGDTALGRWDEVKTTVASAVEKGRDAYEQALGTMTDVARGSVKEVDRQVRRSADDLTRDAGL